MYKRIIALAITLYTSGAWGNELLGMFELPYGSPFPPYTDGKDQMGLPIEILSVSLPLQEKDKLPMFYDYKILYFANTGAVYSAQAQRVYKDPNKCVEDSNYIIDLVPNMLPGLSRDKGYTFSSDKYLVDVSCARTKNEVFYTLAFFVFDRVVHDEIGSGRR